MVGTNPSPKGASFKVSSCAISCKVVPAVDFMQLSTAAQLIPNFSEHWKISSGMSSLKSFVKVTECIGDEQMTTLHCRQFSNMKFV
jgi:hypothetical protein